MKNCIDCGRKLEAASRSKHQPSIRCLDCFAKFADKTATLLEDWVADLQSQEDQT